MMTHARARCAAAVLILAAGVPLVAQSPAPVFEVASIKPSGPGDPANPLSTIPMVMPDPAGGLRATNTPLWMLIASAWGLPDSRIVGGDRALMDAKYDITAKADASGTRGLQDVMPRLRNLLIERFRLEAHLEPRDMPLYDLVLARGDGRLGPELKPSKSDCSNSAELAATRLAAAAKGDLASIMPKPGQFLSCTLSPNLAGGPGNISLHGDGQEIKALVDLVSQFIGRTVRDKTGLTGRYDFDLKLDLQVMLGMVQKLGMNLPTGMLAKLPQADGSSLMTALDEQLGLKLESSRGPVDVLVIERVEPPTPD
jgi:uncharacterized protein (TIGR03435 family)